MQEKLLLIFYTNILQEYLKLDIKQKKVGTGLKILTSKQMFQRLPIALAQILQRVY